MVDILYFSRHTLLRNNPNSEFIKFLKHNKFNVVYLSTYGDVPENIVSNNSHQENSIKVLSHKYKLNKIINYLYSTYLVFKFYYKFKPQIVIIHDSVYAPILIILSLFCRVKVGIHFHEVIWDCGYNKGINFLLRKQEQIVLKFLSISIFPSERRRAVIIGNKIRKDFTFIFTNYQTEALPVYYIPKNKENKKIIYFGAINDFIISDLINVIEQILFHNIEVDIYAFGTRVHELSKYFSYDSRVNFFDPLPRNLLLKIIPNYIASICVYDPKYINNVLCEPRKMYDSVLCGVPVIINEIQAPDIIKKWVLTYDEITIHNLEQKKEFLSKNLEILVNDLNEYSSLLRSELKLGLTSMLNN